MSFLKNQCSFSHLENIFDLNIFLNYELNPDFDLGKHIKQDMSWQDYRSLYKRIRKKNLIKWNDKIWLYLQLKKHKIPCSPVIHYSNHSPQISHIVKNLKNYVIKASHLSLGNGVILVRNGKIQNPPNRYKSNVKSLDLNTIDKEIEKSWKKESNKEYYKDQDWIRKQVPPGVLIEEFIPDLTEIKVSVVWGSVVGFFIDPIRPFVPYYDCKGTPLGNHNHPLPFWWKDAIRLSESVAKKFSYDHVRVDMMYYKNQVIVNELTWNPGAGTNKTKIANLLNEGYAFRKQYQSIKNKTQIDIKSYKKKMSSKDINNLHQCIEYVYSPLETYTPLQATQKYSESDWNLGFFQGSLDSLLKGKAFFNIKPITLPKGYKKSFGAVDPFIWKEYVFAEIMNAKNKGVIAVAKWTEASLTFKVIMEEFFHLSFPFIFEYSQELYMIPESYKSVKIRLYKCIHFPYQWEFYKDIIEIPGFDTIVFPADNQYILLTNLTLNYKKTIVFTSKTPFGPWKEKKQINMNRGGGGLLKSNTQIYIPRQRKYTLYGQYIDLFPYEKVLTSKNPKHVTRLMAQRPFFCGTHHVSQYGNMFVADFLSANFGMKSAINKFKLSQMQAKKIQKLIIES